MLLLTDNRNLDGDDSLEQTIRVENGPNSLPVVTVSNVNRLFERDYRELCALRLVEIVLDVEELRGSGRLFIP